MLCPGVQPAVILKPVLLAQPHGFISSLLMGAPVGCSCGFLYTNPSYSSDTTSLWEVTTGKFLQKSIPFPPALRLSSFHILASKFVQGEGGAYCRLQLRLKIHVDCTFLRLKSFRFDRILHRQRCFYSAGQLVTSKSR